MGSKKNGTNAFKITNVFKQLGFNSIGVKLNLDEINKENRMYFCLFRDKYRLMEKI